MGILGNRQSREIPLRFSGQLNFTINGDRGSAEFELRGVDGTYRAGITRRPSDGLYAIVEIGQQEPRLVESMLDAVQICQLLVQRAFERTITQRLETIAELADQQERG